MIAPLPLGCSPAGVAHRSVARHPRLSRFHDAGRMKRLIATVTLGLLVVAPVPTGSAAEPLVATGSVRAGLLAAAAPWSWPVDPPHTISRTFIAPATAYSAGHRGIDIRAPGATVFAPAPGVVHFVGVVVDRPVLSVRHPDGLISSYEPVTSQLVAGAPVRRGDVIGTVVAGHCVSLCVHFGVRLDGEYVSPLAYLGGIARAVLLPTRAVPQTRRRGGPGRTRRHPKG